MLRASFTQQSAQSRESGRCAGEHMPSRGLRHVSPEPLDELRQSVPRQVDGENTPRPGYVADPENSIVFLDWLVLMTHLIVTTIRTMAPEVRAQSSLNRFC